MSRPKFSIVIPWCNREEIGDTLPQNVPWLKPHGAEILVVNCGGKSAMLRRCLTKAGVREIRQIDVPKPRFNKSLAINLGTFFSKGQSILVLDADVILRSDLLGRSSPSLEKGAFVTVARVSESDPTARFGNPDPVLLHSIKKMIRRNTLDLVFRDGTSIHLTLLHDDDIGWSRAGSGLLLVKKKDLCRIGGYNSAFKGWGWEDNDITARLTYVLGRRHLQIGEALHLSHTDQKRALAGKSAEWNSNHNFNLACLQYSQGNFVGTYATDIATWQKKAKETQI